MPIIDDVLERDRGIALAVADAHTFAEALKPLGLRPQHFGVLTLIASEPGSTKSSSPRC